MRFQTLAFVLLSSFCYAQTNTFPASGNVGIGTTSPGGKLEINQDGGQLKLTGGAVAAGVFTGSGRLYLTDWNTGTKGIIVDLATGNTGIGVAPGAKLSFNNLNDGSNGADGITWYNPSPLEYGIYRTAGPWSGPNYQQLKLSFRTGIALDPGSLYGKSFVDIQGGGLRITSGNLGINTTSPSARLHVQQSTGSWNDGIRMTLAGKTWDIVADSNGDRLVIGKNQSMGQSVVVQNGNIGIAAETPVNKLQIGPNTPGWTGNDLVVGNANGSLAIFTETTHTYLYGSKDIAIRPGYGQMAIYAKSDGNVGIGTTTPDYKLTVKGKIHAEEVKVDLTVPGPDYVFEPDYQLTSLEELKQYIDQHKHLPEIPSAREMETNGINLMEMNVLLLKKVEELTLHVIQLKQEIKEIKSPEKRSQN